MFHPHCSRRREINPRVPIRNRRRVIAQRRIVYSSARYVTQVPARRRVQPRPIYRLPDHLHRLADPDRLFRDLELAPRRSRCLPLLERLKVSNPIQELLRIADDNSARRQALVCRRLQRARLLFQDSKLLGYRCLVPSRTSSKRRLAVAFGCDTLHNCSLAHPVGGCKLPYYAASPHISRAEASRSSYESEYEQ